MAKAYLLFTNPQKAESRNALGALLLDKFPFIWTTGTTLVQYLKCKIRRIQQYSHKPSSCSLCVNINSARFIYPMWAEPPVFVNSWTLITSILLKNEAHHNLTKVTGVLAVNKWTKHAKIQLLTNVYYKNTWTFWNVRVI